MQCYGCYTARWCATVSTLCYAGKCAMYTFAWVRRVERRGQGVAGAAPRAGSRGWVAEGRVLRSGPCAGGCASELPGVKRRGRCPRGELSCGRASAGRSAAGGAQGIVGGRGQSPAIGGRRPAPLLPFPPPPPPPPTRANLRAPRDAASSKLKGSPLLERIGKTQERPCRGAPSGRGTTRAALRRELHFEKRCAHRSSGFEK